MKKALLAAALVTALAGCSAPQVGTGGDVQSNIGRKDFREGVAGFSTVSSACDEFGRRIYVFASGYKGGLSVVDDAPECKKPEAGR